MPPRSSLFALVRCAALILLVTSWSSYKADAEESTSQIVISSSTIPSLPEETANRNGTSGGSSGGALLEFGGMDTNGKCISDSLICPIANTPSNSWRKIPLPDAPAWGATAQHGDEVIVAGGIVNGVPTSKVKAYRWNGVH